MSKFGTLKIDVDDADLKELAKRLGESIPLLNHLAHGGRWDPWGSGDIDFGEGLLSPNLKLDEMVVAIDKVNKVLGISGQAPDVASGAGAAAGATKSDMVQQVAMQAGTVTLSSPSVIVNVPGQEGGAEGQRPNSPGTVHTSGARQDGSAHKFTYGKVSMPG